LKPNELSAALARFRTRNQQKMRGVIDESRIATEAALQHAQGMNKVGVRRRLPGIPVRVGREAAMEKVEAAQFFDPERGAARSLISDALKRCEGKEVCLPFWNSTCNRPCRLS
jgi:hypothetical protein